MFRCSGMQIAPMTARARAVGVSAGSEAVTKLLARRSAAQVLLGVLPFLVIAVVAVADVLPARASGSCHWWHLAPPWRPRHCARRRPRWSAGWP
jgi:hypothetical protein